MLKADRAFEIVGVDTLNGEITIIINEQVRIDFALTLLELEIDSLYKD